MHTAHGRCRHRGRPNRAHCGLGKPPSPRFFPAPAHTHHRFVNQRANKGNTAHTHKNLTVPKADLRVPVPCLLFPVLSAFSGDSRPHFPNTCTSAIVLARNTTPRNAAIPSRPLPRTLPTANSADRIEVQPTNQPRSAGGMLSGDACSSGMPAALAHAAPARARGLDLPAELFQHALVRRRSHVRGRDPQHGRRQSGDDQGGVRAEVNAVSPGSAAPPRRGTRRSWRRPRTTR